MMNLKELKELIELISEKGFAEFEIERQGFRLRISRFQDMSQTIAQPAPSPIIISPTLSAAEVRAPAAKREPLQADVDAAAESWQEAAADVKASAATTEAHLFTIKSPIVGTFYRAASPTSEPFVKAGDQVGPETVVCIIEAMKLMNEIQAEVTGE